MNHNPPHTPIRIALAGLGGHGRTLQTATEKMADLEVVTVFDPNDREAHEAADRFGCTMVDTYEDLLSRNGVDAVVIASPNFIHRDQAVTALEAGLHTFVEKPIANRVEDGRAMVEAARRNDRILMVGRNMRYARSVGKAREILDAGRLGEVVTVELHYSADNTHRMPSDAWRLRPDQCPLLPVMQLAIHGIDLIDMLVGPVEDVTAQARSVTTTPGVVDSVTAMFRLTNGVLGTMVSNYCTPVGFEYRIAGTRGTLFGTPHRVWFRSATDTDWHGEGPIEEYRYLEFDLESYDIEMVAFAEAIRTGTQPLAGAESSLRALAVVEAMHRSVNSGKTEPVDHAT